MNLLVLLWAIETISSAQPVRLLGCSEAFAAQFQSDWAVEGVDAGSKDALTVTCLADGGVVLEVPSLDMRRSVNAGDDQDVSQQRIVAVIAAELLAEAASRRRPEPPPPVDEAQTLGTRMTATPEPPRQTFYTVHAGGLYGFGADLHGSLQGAFVGANRGTSWDRDRRIVATVEACYEAAEVARSLGIVRTRLFGGSALLGVQSLGRDFHVGLAGGIKAGRAFVQGTPTEASDVGSDLSATVASPMLRLTLSMPWRRLSLFGKLDTGYAVTKVRAQVVNDADATMAGLWGNVGIGVSFNLN